MHLASVELLGVPPLSIMLILSCLAAQTFPQSSSSPKGGSSVCWCVYPWTELLRQQSKIHPFSQFPQNTLYPEKPLSILPVSFALLFVDIVFSFSQGMHLMGNNLGLKEKAQLLSRHTLDNDCSSLMAVFTSTLHKHHRKSSTPTHTYSSSPQYGS